MAFTTRGSLLSAVRRGDEIGWNEFYEMYKPLILLRGNDLRLTQTEKEELVQLVMSDFFGRSKTFVYDKSLGRFRDYFKTIIKHKAYDLMRKRRNGEISIELVKAEVESIFSEGEDIWQKEWGKHILAQAFEEVKLRVETTTLQSYDLYVIQQVPVKEISKLLKISANTIYQHKHSVEEKLCEIIKRLDD